MLMKTQTVKNILTYKEKVNFQQRRFSKLTKKLTILQMQSNSLNK